MTRINMGTSPNHAATSLPAASRERWQPIRGGILNLYLYDYEEFRYEKGHLILRGNNGTGKSRVMALQLPFLFDGHLASNRVEPDADPSKKMEWNLLMGRHAERAGYTWIEFGRLIPGVNGEGNGELPLPPNTGSLQNGENGYSHPCGQVQRFVTLGCCLSATKGSGMREPWFFITDQRIGQDLFLQSDAGHALSKVALGEAIGERGTVYTTAKDYRAGVDEKLFGLGKQRYEAMVDLLIQLRKPQLSKNLDEKMLAGVLAEALPPPAEHMIADVAESFRGLETDRMELERFRSGCEGVDSFLKTYRRYAQIASRRRAGNVRQSHNRYETANRELRKTEQECTEATTQLATVTGELRALEIRDEELEAQIRALNADPKMRSADAISEADDHEQQALRDLQAAKSDSTAEADRLELRQATQRTALHDAETRLKAAAKILKRSSELALDCGVRSEHDVAFSCLSLHLEKSDEGPDGDPQAIRRQVDDVNARRIKSSEQLKKLNEALAAVESVVTQAKKERDDAQQRVNQAIEGQRSAEERRRGAIDDFLESYRMWRRDCDDLIVPSEEDIAADVDEWSQRTDGLSPVAKAIDKAASDVRRSLHEERVRLQHLVDALAREQSDAEKLAKKLAQGFHEPPPLPFRADESLRAAKPGAPFWSLVDFARSCPGQHSTIEATLEAAGILNAWVMPDGSVLSSDFSDVLLRAPESPDVPENRSLIDVLMADDARRGPSRGVSSDVIERVLGTIGYGEQNSPTWISPDGRWRNGPLHGYCQKESAQYIGNDAREGQRTRHLAQVQTDLKRYEEQRGQYDEQRQTIENKSASLVKQLEAAPGDFEIRAAATSMSVAMQNLIDRRKALTEAEQVVADRQTKARAAREARDRDAQDLGLFEWIDRLDDLIRSISDYRQALAELWPSIEHCASLRAQYETAVAASREVEENVRRLDEKQHEQQIRHAKAMQRLKTLRETIGVEADEIQRQLAAVEEIRRSLVAQLKQGRSKETNAAKELARTEERITSRRQTINEETEARQRSCDAFKRLCVLGLLKTAMEEPHDDGPSDWSISRTVEMARQTESAFSQINVEDAAWDRVQGAVNTTIQELNSALSQHGFTPTLSTTDDLYCVSVPYQGHDRSVQDLRNLLSEEVQHRGQILDERERTIIENHLIGEVAAQLHEQIHQAYELVEKMNAEIQKRPMSTGMMLKFDWKPDEDLSPGMVEMCKKLLAATGTWSPTERTAIGRYLQDHIKSVRHSREAGTWHEHLAEALDYRKWHRFWVMTKQDSVWKRLTRRTHGTKSTGEKAVALTIPQFAAAAAHYSSARIDAPRFILLDEAFAGIDPDMRGKCMELISTFDLDFLMTSESEWGCYAGTPGVAIHQLSTRSGFEAVFLTRWIWNGKQRVKDETPLPSATRRED